MIEKIGYFLFFIFILLVLDAGLFYAYKNRDLYYEIKKVAVASEGALPENNSQKLNYKPENINNKFENLRNNFISMKKQEYQEKNIIFVGDIMLDRAVESLMKKNGQDYPFLQITSFLNNYDFVMANLEGAVVEDPPNLPGDSLTFAFDDSVAVLLRDNNIKLVSLANNHTMNMKQSGFQETKEILTKAKINFIGEPVKCSDGFYEYDDLVFLAFNTTFKSCKPDDILKLVTKVKKENPDKFLIVNMHWGQEYKTKNSKAQQELAHQLIDSGVDLIIGHHPHVVQNIEMYKNKIIFYSLGNFIFDQYFSKNTQIGLAVGLEIDYDYIRYRLYPIQGNFSQPRLMEDEKEKQFLESLSANSQYDLKQSIINGEIKIKK